MILAGYIWTFKKPLLYLDSPHETLKSADKQLFGLELINNIFRGDSDTTASIYSSAYLLQV